MPGWPAATDRRVYEDPFHCRSGDMPMSAAQPADPAHPYVNKCGDAAVISLVNHRRRTGGRTGPATEGRWTMDTPPAPTPQSGPDPGRGRVTSLRDVADEMEEWFAGVQRTLADEDTRIVVVRTVEFIDHILRGAVDREMISEEQRIKLSELLDAARQAPDLI